MCFFSSLILKLPKVRDAGCYVLWACARAYAGEVLAPHALAAGSGLLEVALLDRELNCRRAASAAIQEHVGRLGLLPHGLQLVALTDYFKLATLRASFLEVAPSVSQYPELSNSDFVVVVSDKLHLDTVLGWWRR